MKSYRSLAPRFAWSAIVAACATFCNFVAAQDDPFAPPADAAAENDPFGAPQPQPQPKEPAPEEPLPDATRPIAPPTSGFEVELLDGSLLRGELDITELEVATKYGLLKVPLTELVSVSPGLNTRAAQKAKLSQLIERLGADAYGDREQAQAELMALGPQVIDIVRPATLSDNAERAARAKAILENFAVLEQTWGPSQVAPLSEFDEVTTREFAASGQVQLKSLTVEGVYGQVTVDLQHVKRLQRASMIRPQETFATTKVNGQHITLLKTHNSEIMVRRGDNVSIRATGMLKREGSSYLFRPEGNSNYGFYNEAQRIMTGALVVQVGEGGEVKLAGSKCNFVADADGPLHFSIAAAAQYARYNLEGDYEVSVRVSSK